MKTTLLFIAVSLLPNLASAQTVNVTRGVDVKGADVTGSNVTGSSVKGVDVKGPDVSGSSVTGGSVKGGSVTGGSVTGGSVTGGSVSGGSVTAGTVTPGMVTSFVDGREIQVSSVNNASVNSVDGKAEVKLGDQMLTIEKSQLTLDGKPLATMPESTKKVQVSVKEGMLSVHGDGKEVARVKMK